MQPNRSPAGNFEFLRAEWPHIYDGAVRAERVVNFDPRTAYFQARRAVELTVKWLYVANDIPTPYRNDLAARLHDPAFQAIVPPNLRQKMDLIRRRGNEAVHDEKPIAVASGVRLVEELFHIMSWLAREFASQQSDRPDPRTQFDPNRLPKPGAGNVAKTIAQIQALNAEMEAKDAALAKANAERDDLAAQVAARDAAISQQQAAFDADKASTDQLIAKLRAQVAAAHASAAKPDTHDYNEAQTRTDLIDLLLREAGWALTDERDREYPVVGMPTVDGGSGNGRVDYVLWGDDGLPLAVVEAKRTSTDPQAGKHQAKLYADCLEQMMGQRPIIFYTNGIEIYLWDDTRYPRRLVDQNLQSAGAARGTGDMVDELEFAVRLEQTGVRPDGVDVHAGDVLGRRDQHVGHRSRRQLDHQVVDRVSGGALDDVEGQDVGTHRTERHGQGAEAAGPVVQLDTQEIRGHGQHSGTGSSCRHFR